MLKWMSVLLLCALAATAAEQEPSYNGRLLSEWLGDMRLGQLYDGPSPTQRAVQAMGTNAIPTLLKWMSYEPSPSELSSHIEEMVPHWRPITNLNLYPAQRAQRAGAAFGYLGSMARSTIPELTRLARTASNPSTAGAVEVATTAPMSCNAAATAHSCTENPYERHRIPSRGAVAAVCHQATAQGSNPVSPTMRPA